MNIKVSLFLSFLILINGCAGYQRMYEGAQKSPEEVSIISATGNETDGFLGIGYSNILIRTVDGQSSIPSNMKPNSVEVLPGVHTFEIGLYNARSQSFATFTLDVKKGHRYEIRFEEARSESNPDMVRVQSSWVVDLTENKVVMNIREWTLATEAIWITPIYISY